MQDALFIARLICTGQLSHKNYKQVVKSVETSKEWPENLGVGKPYDNMIDNRLEDYLEAKAAAGQGDSRKTSALLAAVADYTISRFFQAEDGIRDPVLILSLVIC